jgi:leucyl-tRNA synthetase
MDRSRIEAEALQDERVRSVVGDRRVQKVVYVPRRLVNIVVEG